MLTKTEICPEDQRLLIEAAGNLPSVTVYLNIASSEQASKIGLVQEHFQDIKLALQAYFSGQPNPIGTGDRKRQQFIEGEVDYYLSIYNLFWFGWCEIQAKATQQLFSQADQTIFPKTPGEALALILAGDCDSMCDLILNNAKVNVRESKSVLKSGRPNLGEYSGLDLKRAERTNKYCDLLTNRMSLSGELISFSQDAIKKRLRGNPRLNRKLQDFKAVQKRHFSDRRKMLVGVKGW